MMFHLIHFLCLWIVVVADWNNSLDPDNFTSVAYNVTHSGTVIEILTQPENVTTNDTAITESPTDLDLPSTEIPPTESNKKQKTKTCSCDISDSCDEYCCCDPDCFVDDVNTVEHCRGGDQSVLDISYCSNSKPKYDLFCVVYDNLQQRHYYVPPEKIGDPSSLRNVKVNNPYSWMDEELSQVAETDELVLSDSFKTKGPLFVFLNGIEEPIKLSLPHPRYNDFCDSEESVRYMVDVSYQCLHSIDTVSGCERGGVFDLDRYANFTLLSLIRDNSTNETSWDTGSIRNFSRVPVTFSRVYSYHNLQEGTTRSKTIDSGHSFPTARLDSFGNVCHNTVLSISYVITHSGRRGIDSVKLDFELGDVSFKKPFAQSFRVTFKYQKETANRKENPGYKLGQYMVVGKNASQNDSVKNKIISTFNFRTLRPNFSGSCQSINSTLTGLKFGINLNSGCVLKVYFNPRDKVETRCSKLGKVVRDYIFDFDNAHTVASFAKSDPDDPTAWVHIRDDGLNFVHNLVDNRVCHFITSLRIEIFHARTGLVGNPQAKVLDIFIKAFPEPVLLCSGANCPPTMEINLRTTVSYKDMTSKPSYIFGRPPKVHVTLPSDFFYPFLSNAQISVESAKIILIFAVLSGLVIG